MEAARPLADADSSAQGRSNQLLDEAKPLNELLFLCRSSKPGAFMAQEARRLRRLRARCLLKSRRVNFGRERRDTEAGAGLRVIKAVCN